MRAVRSWVIGAAAAAALAPTVAVAAQRASSFAVTVVSVRSVPIQLRPSPPPPRATRPAARATAISRGDPGSIVFVDGAPAAFTFRRPDARRAPAPGAVYPR
jgi:hypothetical protein